MEYVRLVIADMSWQFAIVLVAFAFAWVVLSLKRAWMRSDREDRRHRHQLELIAAQKAAKVIEHDDNRNRHNG